MPVPALTPQLLIYIQQVLFAEIYPLLLELQKQAGNVGCSLGEFAAAGGVPVHDLIDAVLLLPAETQEPKRFFYFVLILN